MAPTALRVQVGPVTKEVDIAVLITLLNNFSLLAAATAPRARVVLVTWVLGTARRVDC